MFYFVSNMKRKIILGVLLAIILIVVFVAYKFFGPSVSRPDDKEFFLVRTGSDMSDVKR